MYEIPDVMSFKPSEILERLQPNIANEEEKKSLFGVELGKGITPFQAALNVCGDNTQQALWISQRWINDPVVIAAKDLYLKTVYNSEALLDADQLAARLLEMAEERNASNTFYMLEGKDRVAVLKLYAEVRGLIRKDTPAQNNFTFNKMTVKFVSPEKKEQKNLELSLNDDQSLNNKSGGAKLKLVSA